MSNRPPFCRFLGACFRKYALVKLYSASTWILVLATAVASGFFYYFAYSGKDVFNGCEIKDQQGQEHDCRIVLKTWQKIVFTIVTVVVLLVFVCTYPSCFSPLWLVVPDCPIL